jgi:hypothetical protein
MDFEGKSRRIKERLKLTIPVRVQCRETAEREWVEVTRLLDVTPFGAGFTLGRITEPGRLLHLTLPMPRQLRCFDHIEEQYRVWSIVRRVLPRFPKEAAAATGQAMTGQASTGQGAAGLRFEIGVGFVGKNPPASYLIDPTTRYEIAPSPTDVGLWELHEKSTAVEVAPDAAGHAAPRSGETRLQMPVEVIVEVIDERGEVGTREQTVTENISRRGAAVLTTLGVERGGFVRLTSARLQLSVFAAVRARRTGADGIARLHLEFIDRQWPLEGVE